MRGVDISKKMERLRTLSGRPLSVAGFEYLLVLSPPPALWERIMRVKAYFGNKYECPQAVKSKPHITLARFFSPIIAQTSLVGRLERVTDTLYPFSVMLDNFGSFPSHTIFLQMATREPVRQVINKVKAVRHLMKVPEEDPHFIDEPHLTIARKLLPWQYEQGWQEFANLDFKGKFVADGLLLLHRPADGSPHAYRVTKQLLFRGRVPEAPVQCNLFD